VKYRPRAQMSRVEVSVWASAPLRSRTLAGKESSNRRNVLRSAPVTAVLPDDSDAPCWQLWCKSVHFGLRFMPQAADLLAPNVLRTKQLLLAPTAGSESTPPSVSHFGLQPMAKHTLPAVPTPIRAEEMPTRARGVRSQEWTWGYGHFRHTRGLAPLTARRPCSSIRKHGEARATRSGVRVDAGILRFHQFRKGAGFDSCCYSGGIVPPRSSYRPCFHHRAGDQRRRQHGFGH